MSLKQQALNGYTSINIYDLIIDVHSIRLLVCGVIYDR